MKRVRRPIKKRHVYLISLTKGKRAQIDPEDWHLVSHSNWIAQTGYNDCWYAAARIRGAFVYMHRVIAAAPKGRHVDHVNGNGLDNRKKNLRLCSNSENMANGSSRRTAKRTSKYRGVYSPSAFAGRNKRFVARITKDGKSVSLGCYATESSAALAYNRAAKSLFGRFAFQNKL